MFTISTLIVVVNWLYSVLAFSQSVTYLAKSKVIVKHSFTIGWFINIYWLAFGLYFNWYGNIVITLYFIWLNYMGNRNWGNRPLKNTIIPKVALFIGIALTFITGWLTNALFNNIPSTINVFNCCLYAVTYTLKAMGPRYKSKAIALQLVNLVAYIPMVLMVNPILWGCAIRQTLAVFMYLYALIGKQRIANIINNYKPSTMLYYY